MSLCRQEFLPLRSGGRPTHEIGFGTIGEAFLSLRKLVGDLPRYVRTFDPKRIGPVVLKVRNNSSEPDTDPLPSELDAR